MNVQFPKQNNGSRYTVSDDSTFSSGRDSRRHLTNSGVNGAVVALHVVPRAIAVRLQADAVLSTLVVVRLAGVPAGKRDRAGIAPRRILAQVVVAKTDEGGGGRDGAG